MRVGVEGVEVQIVTPQSPVGQALLGRQAGDVVDVRVKGVVREYEVLEVR
jgi:transcription elongation GreA/GreB family factor